MWVNSTSSLSFEKSDAGDAERWRQMIGSADS